MFKSATKTLVNSVIVILLTALIAIHILMRPVTYTEILPGEIKLGDPNLVRIETELRTMRKQDKMIIYVNCFGGDVSTGMALISAMKETKGHVELHVTSWAASMAATMLVAGEDVYVTQDAFILFHVARIEKADGTIDMDDSKDPILRAYNILLYHMIHDLFTKQELINIFIFHQDYLITGEDFRNRLCTVRHICHPATSHL